MTATPRVSVIMAVYNEERFIAESVESVLAQSYSDFEVIISDDGSTDETPTIARSFAERHPERIRVLRAEHNQGKPFALNRALAVRRGELIAWLDGDDVMLPGKLERQVAALDSDHGAAGCTHDAEVFDSDSGRTIGRFSQIYNGSPLRSGGIELWFDPTYRMLPSATMVRSSLCPLGGFDERLTYANDWLFDIEVFRYGRCVAIDDVLVRYRRHSDNFTTRADASGASYEEGHDGDGARDRALSRAPAPRTHDRCRDHARPSACPRERAGMARGGTLWRGRVRGGRDHGGGGCDGGDDALDAAGTARRTATKMNRPLQLPF